MKRKNFYSLMNFKSVFLHVMMILGFFAFQNVNANPDSNDPLSRMGFNLAQPEEMSNPSNPYGNGVKNLNPFHELMVSGTMSSYEVFDPKKWSKPLEGNPLTNPNFLASQWTFKADYPGELCNFQRVYAGDFTGSGKTDLIAEVFIYDLSLHLRFVPTSNVMLPNHDYYNRTKLGQIPKIATSDINPWAFSAFLSAAVGDFNGDGKDEIAIFISSLFTGENRIAIYSYTNGNAKLEKTILMPDNLKVGNFTSSILSDHLSVQMAAGDLTRDGKADLAVVANFHRNSGLVSNFPNNCASRLLIYNAGDNFDMQLQSQQRELRFRNGSDQQVFNLRNAGVVIGDINGDGFAEEIVVGGNFSKSSWWDVEKNNGGDRSPPKVAITWFNVNGGAGKGQLTGGVYVNAFDVSNGATGHGRNLTAAQNEDRVQPPVALVSFKEKGNGHPEAVFLDGGVYRYNNAFLAVENAVNEIARNAKHQGQWLTYYSQAIAGNFTKDPTGKEGVIFIHTTRHDGNRYTVGSIMLVNEIDDRWSSQYTHDKLYLPTAFERTVTFHLSIAAIDYDNDGMLVRYTGEKEYYFTDPKVVTILQAAPFFEEIGDDGYASNGSTSISHSTGQGQSTSQSVSVSAGIVLGFEQDISVLGLFDAVGFEFDVKISASMGYEFQWSKERTTSISVSSPSDADRVIVSIVPYTRYTYEMYTPKSKLMGSRDYDDCKRKLLILENSLQKLSIDDTEYEKIATEIFNLKRQLENVDRLLAKGYKWGADIPGGWAPHVVNIPAAPRTMTITVDEYDAIALEHGLQPIRGNALPAHKTVGNPAAYRSAPVPGADRHGDDWQTVSNSGLSTRTLEISETTTTSHGLTWGLAHEMSMAMKGGGVKVGVTTSLNYDGGFAWSNTSGNTFSGTVSDLPLGTSGYMFDWQFMIHGASVNGENCITLEYLVRNVVRPPQQQITPVTDVSVLSATTTANVPLALMATITPYTATNQTIVWSVKDAGTTGAAIAGDRFVAATAGTAVITATITNGEAQGANFTKDFTITVNHPVIAVTGITDVPATATVNAMLPLTATITPEDATNRNIVWSVKNAGATGAEISSDVFLATSSGLAIVTATIANGVAAGKDYVKDFFINVEFLWQTATPPTVKDGDILEIRAGAGGTLNIPANATITVFGNGQVNNNNNPIALNIGANATVVWQADYKSANSINISGSGAFMFAVTPNNGSIEAGNIVVGSGITLVNYGVIIGANIINNGIIECWTGAISGSFNANRAVFKGAVTFPSGALLSYGQSLSEAVFMGGGSAGGFAFGDASARPTVAQSGAAFEAAFTLAANGANYQPITADVRLTVVPALIEKPSVTGDPPIYNGAAQSPVIAASDAYVITGNVQTKVGVYQAKVALKDKANYTWSDGTTNDLLLDWSILCNHCGETGCEGNHVQCPVCGEWDCEKEHVKCSVCGEWDCEQDHNITSVAETVNYSSLRAWVRNGLLHVNGLIPGEMLSIYSTTGALVYRSIATGVEMDIPLSVQGVYIVRAGINTVRVVW